MIEALKDYDCIPVFLDMETINKFLLFHETVLRPMFHSFKGLDDFEYDLSRSDMWNNFIEVNDQFASMIKEIKQEKEMIWIHDNYLIMVPIIIRR